MALYHQIPFFIKKQTLIKHHYIVLRIQVHNRIIRSNLGKAQSVNEIWPVSAMLQKNCSVKVSSRPFCICKKMKHNTNCKSAHRPPQVFFYIGFFEYQKRAWNQFPGHTFHKFLDKKFSLVILDKLTIFHYQTVFTSSYSLECFMFHAQTIGDIMTFERLKS